MRPLKLGKIVTVTADTSAPKNGTVFGTFSVMGGVMPAYVFGFDTSAKSYTGRVVAMLSREGESDISIVVPQTEVLYEWQIRRALEPVMPEPYHLRCFYEKSCGAVLFTGDGPYRRYLILQNRSGHNGFPKGHVEADETEVETALREIREETGISATLLPGFRHSYVYFPNHYSQKEGVYFLGRFENQTLHTQRGEIFGAWLLPFDEAYAELAHEQDRVLLKLAAKAAETLA